MAPSFAPAPHQRSRRARLLTGVVSFVVGASVTLTLFSAMAQFENVQPPPDMEEIEDLRIVSVPAELPPPRPIEQTEAVAVATAPMANIQIGASDSPVKIAVVPPELAMLFPPEASAPPARIEVSNLFSDLKPRSQMTVDPKRIYQQSEVDQIPTVLYRADPRIPSWTRKNADMLRVSFVILCDTTGSVASVRLTRPSGNDAVDKIIMDCVKAQWLFTPAMKNGKKVRCLFQQTVTVRWSNTTLFGY